MIGIDLSRNRPEEMAGHELRIVNYFTERMMKMETQDCLKAIDVANPNVGMLEMVPEEAGMKIERLPFTVRLATSEEELAKAVSIRHQAYARHVPALAQSLTQAEPYDFEKGTVVLLAESKLDGSPLGTMRIQTNAHKKLTLEQSVVLPDWLQGASLAEATRLGIAEGRMGRIVKTALFKAYFEFCQSSGIEWMVITARAPLDRQYAALLFRDVFGVGEYIPMRHVGNIPHRVLAFEIGSAKARWAAVNHPLLNFMCGTHHPDISISSDGVFSPRLEIGLPNQSIHAIA